MKSLYHVILALCVIALPFASSAQSLLITNATVTPSEVRIEWNAASNLYILAQTPSLATGATTYAGDVVAANTSTVSNETTPSFYRVRQVEAVTFPDPNFEAAVRLNIPHKYAPTNRVYDIDVESITTLAAQSAAIGSVVGIHWMNGLTNLNCSENPLAALDVSMLPDLVQLDCQWTDLSFLDLSAGNILRTVSCNDCFLTNLNVTGCAELAYLDCSNNSLPGLDLSANTNLVDLDCTWNLLTNLTVSANTHLENLWCYNNELTQLDVSSNTQLIEMNCSRNSLTNLVTPVNGNLDRLYCLDNQLTTLDISGNTNLTVVWATSNPLVEIVVWDTNNLPAEFYYDGTPWIHEP